MTPIPVKARAANRRAVRRLRCGIRANPGRDHQPGSSPRKPAKDVLQNREVGVAETKTAERQTHRPWYQNEPRNRADRAERAPQFRAGTQPVMPTMFGPGMNWQRVRISANS